MTQDQIRRLWALVADTPDGSDGGAILAAVYAVLTVGTNREIRAFVKATNKLAVQFRLLERLQSQNASAGDVLELAE